MHRVLWSIETWILCKGCERFQLQKQLDRKRKLRAAISGFLKTFRKHFALEGSLLSASLTLKSKSEAQFESSFSSISKAWFTLLFPWSSKLWKWCMSKRVQSKKWLLSEESVRCINLWRGHQKWPQMIPKTVVDHSQFSDLCLVRIFGLLLRR